MEELKTVVPETEKDVAFCAAAALYGKQGIDIKMFHVTENTIVADYYVICSARSSTHIKALADEVCYKLSLQGRDASHVEGRDGGTWVLVDLGSVIVHIFSRDAREFYNIERLQPEESEINLEEFFKAEDEKNIKIQ